MPETRPLSPLESGDELTWRLLAMGLALTAALVGSAPLGTSARAEDASAVASPAPLVVFRDGKLSVDVYDVELSEVLQRIATLAGFQLTTEGSLSRVTAVFTGVSLEEGLRRLVQDHELMLVYRAPGEGGAGGDVVEAHVFAGSPSRAASDTATALAEIAQLLRSADQRNVPRVSEFLSWSDATVRVRAAQALGVIGGPAAASTLERALGDEAPQVRIQVVYALRRLQGVQSIPALADVLVRDSDVTVRRAAAGALGTLRDASAASALKAAMADPDPAVRQQATRALRRQGVALP